ncbi:MAG: SH3 domain-containing protein [Rhizobiaceae bacterium]
MTIVSAIRALAVTAILVAPFAAPAPAMAGMCEGRVHGLSSNYNPATGSGFLAVRSKPSTSGRKLGELFNGDRVEIFKRSGNWYKIAAYDQPLEGWAHARWIDNDCGW